MSARINLEDPDGNRGITTIENIEHVRRSLDDALTSMMPSMNGIKTLDEEMERCREAWRKVEKQTVRKHHTLIP